MLKMRGFQGLKKFLIAEGPKVAVLFFCFPSLLGSGGGGGVGKDKNGLYLIIDVDS